METKTKLCCLLNPSYKCCSCGFTECAPCLNKKPGTHFRGLTAKDFWASICSVTGKKVSLVPRSSISETWQWVETNG